MLFVDIGRWRRGVRSGSGFTLFMFVGQGAATEKVCFLPNKGSFGMEKPTDNVCFDLCGVSVFCVGPTRVYQRRCMILHTESFWVPC